jgi:DNA-binding beta-propeller fold protein YncE
MGYRRVAVTLVLLTMLVGVATWMYGSTQAVPGRFLPHTVLLRGQPVAIAVDTRTNRAFVATLNTRSLYGVGSVSVLDTIEGKRLHTMTVGITPQTVAVDGRTGRAFVVNAGHGGARYTVSVLDAHIGALLRTVSVAGTRPNGIVVDERRGHLLIVNSGSVNGAAVAIGTGSVSMLDARTGAILHVTRVGTNPGNVAMDEMTERAFVVDSGATFMSPGSVSVLDVRDGRLLRTVPVGQGAGTVVVDERAGRIFVNTRSGLRVLDAKSGRVVGILPVDGSAMAVDERANRVFAVGYGHGTMAILDARTGRVLHTVPHAIPVGDNAIGVSVDAQDGHVVVIADNADGGSISILTARTGRPQHVIFLGSDPAAVAVDARTGHAFVANAGDGALSAAQTWRHVPSWLRWLPFLPQPEPPTAPGSVSMVDASH